MFDGLIQLAILLIGLVLFIPGILLIFYGFYSMSITGFDKMIRFICFAGGVILVSLGIAIFLNLSE